MDKLIRDILIALGFIFGIALTIIAGFYLVTPFLEFLSRLIPLPLCI